MELDQATGYPYKTGINLGMGTYFEFEMLGFIFLRWSLHLLRGCNNQCAFK